MRKILIVQSRPFGGESLIWLINAAHPELNDVIKSTDSFDHALDLVSSSEEVTVITGEVFRDDLSAYHKQTKQKLPDCEKCGGALARLIKEKNPKAKVIVFSEQQPKDFDYLDAYILRTKKPAVDLKNVMRFLTN